MGEHEIHPYRMNYSCSELVKERRINLVGCDFLETEFQSLKQRNQLRPIDKFDWRNAIARGFATCLRRERAGCVIIPLSARPAMAPRKSRTCDGTTDSWYLLHWNNTWNETRRLICRVP